MGVLQRFERRLGDLVEGAFAKVFRGSVEPVELAHALQREADEHRTISPSRTLVPNDYVASLGPEDWERLAPYAETLGEELATMLTEHCRESGYSTIGPIQVRLEPTDDLVVGTFRLRSGVERLATERVTARRDELDRGDLNRAREDRGDPAFRTMRADPSQRAPQAPPGAGLPAPAPFVGPLGASPLSPPAVFHARAGAPPPTAVAPPAPEPRWPPRPDPVSRAGRARLLVIGDHEGAPGGQPGGRPDLELTEPLTVLGRGTEAQLRLTHTSVSRRHAQIEHYPDVRAPGGAGHWVLSDLGSTNGTSVNGRRVEQVEIHDGDRIDLGGASLIFQIAPDAAACR